MPKAHPTIYDVAQAAGCSIATVSRVLNTPEKVNEQTRAAVLRAIKELDFVPRADARARALKDSGRIGVLAPLFTSQSFNHRLRGVAAALAGTNFELVIHNVDSRARLNSYLDTLPYTHNLDGLIVMSVRIDDAAAQHLSSMHLETVLIEYPNPALSSVEIDDQEGGRMAAAYLFSKGHTRLAFIGGFDDPEFGIHPIGQRLEGFRQYLQERGVSFLDEYNQMAPYDVEGARYQARQLLARENRPTGIFAATDLQAMGVLKACQDLSLSVPEEVAVVGFDDLDFSSYINLTTIRQPLDESGRVAVELLFSRLANPERPLQHVRLPLTLIERGTA